MEEGAEIQHTAECLLDIEASTAALDDLRAKRKATAHKVRLESLAQEDRPTQLLPLNKMLCDTVTMIAYRAETALVAILRRHLNKEEEARAPVRALCVSSADLAPDVQAKTLTVRIHRMASPVHDRVVTSLLKNLNELDFRHPATGDKMIYSLV